jgi:hypothetical protein
MRMRLLGSRRHVVVTSIAATIAVMLVAGTAYAVTLDDQELTGKEGTEWDAEGNYTYGTGGGPCTGVDGTTQEVGYTPADDGENNFSSDAFDGGLFLLVNGDAFGNGIEDGTLSGDAHQLTVGPQSKSGLSITRRDRALQTSPTLRSLISFRNNSTTNKTVNIVWDSAMGADEEERTRASSSGDLRHREEDRWIVASDDVDNADLSDPPILFVFYGKAAPKRVTSVIFAPEDSEPENGIGEGCVAVRYRITVPARSTRFMLLFTELGLDNGDAKAQAPKYNRQRLNDKLLVGITDKVKRRIVNWDLI